MLYLFERKVLNDHLEVTGGSFSSALDQVRYLKDNL